MSRRLPPGACAAIAAVMITAALPATAGAQQLVILVRHAERADGGSTSPTAESDPRLSAAGAARAERLAAMLAEAGIRAIYATEYRRTQDTGQPLAARLGLTVRSMPGRDAAALVARLRAEHAKDVVLVIGHSNTIPAVIKALGGPEVTIGDAEYDNLFIFVPATGTLTRIRYGP